MKACLSTIGNFVVAKEENTETSNNRYNIYSTNICILEKIN